MRALPDEHPIDTLQKMPLEPSEYCRRWVPAVSGKGYRKVCINALAEVTGLSPSTVKDWGPNFERRPKYVPRLLRQADLLNQFKELVLSGRVNTPSNFLQD